MNFVDKVKAAAGHSPKTRLQKQLDGADPKISQYLANKYGVAVPPQAPVTPRRTVSRPSHAA